ncbi:MAG: CotH kinase family protein, partial [Bacteroidales bacterium]|nr:CotH kinase family protein [Bacteroidales bacterium]
NRSNGEASATREAFINIADDSVLPAIWTDVDFINNIDGWTTDDEGRNCLRIPAGTSVELPISSFNLLSGDNCTIEICYKAANCSDYDEPIITISPNPSAAGFKGIRIKPTNITIHSSSDTGADKDTLQGTNLCDEEPVHFVLTINPYYEGNNKLVKGYVNGCKNFLFEYTSSTQWAGFDGSITIGAARTDVFVYFIRHYPVALSDAAVQTNYINSLASVSEREDMDSLFASVLDAGATNIDYEAVKNNGYNFFVIQMTQGNGVPSAANGWGKKTEGLSILEMHFGAHPEWDWKIENPETMGQGTTSMNYYRWNIRWRINKANKGTANEKKVPVSYVTERTKVGGSYQYTWGEASWSKTVRFDGTAHPPVMRITAKINQASSMQSHKIGATRAYDELHKAIGLENEAQAAARLGNTPIPTVAVYEYPAFGFEYDAYSNTYTFIGLFTIGPDKGDKPTFGYDAVKSSLITLEGTDHSQPTAKFAYPWIESNPVGAKGDVAYYYNEEGIGINLGEGSYLTGLEISNCHGREIDKDNGAADQDAVRAILDTEFKPAYLLAWENSTLIFPITTDHPYYDRDVAHTLENINSHLSGETYAVNFRLGQYNSRLGYADMQFWIEGDASYTLYYFDEAFGLYKPDISLSQQLGTPSGATATEKNEWFKEQRRARFKADAADYWDLDECLYHFAFCLLIGATDNFAKNSYPYKMATIAGGGRWRWRQDDLDTIFDTDNSGRDSKPYQIEYEDAINNTPYFAGSNSVFWNLINECYWDDYNNGAGRGIRTIGRNIINQMTRLSQSNNPYDGFVRYITKCFWGNAQDYFPVSAYNVDCVFKYEQAWLVNGQNVPPLTQALGNHYSGERLWVRRRAVYILSLFRYGPFGDYSDTTLGTISFRPNSLTVSLSPILWMYPALAVGQNNVVTGGRTQPGAVCVLSQSSDGNTAFYIQASNYFTSLGSLKGLRLGQQDIGNITITAAKLIQLIAGSVTAGEVTTNIPGFELSQKTKCLEVIDLRNASSITALNGLANCTRLRSLLLSGTNIPSVDVPTGSKVENLSLPGALQRLVLLSLKHLSSFSIASYASIITLHIEDTAYDAMAILLAAYNGSS